MWAMPASREAWKSRMICAGEMPVARGASGWMAQKAETQFVPVKLCHCSARSM